MDEQSDNPSEPNTKKVFLPKLKRNLNLHNFSLSHQGFLIISATTFLLLCVVILLISRSLSNRQNISKYQVQRPGLPIPTNKPTDNAENFLGYVGYNRDGKRFILALPSSCKELDKGTNEYRMSRYEIDCETDNFRVTINPQEGGRGLGDYQPAGVETGNIIVDEHTWEYIIWIDKDGAAFSSYSLTDPETKDYYLIGVNYYPYSESAREYFNQILSTFKFTINTKTVANPTPTPVTIPLISTTNWQTISNGNISFKIPTEATCNNPQQCTLVSWASDYNGHTLYHHINIDVQRYQGGSRRVQFFQKYNSYDINVCNFIYQEAFFGSISALQIANDGGQCQGGGGGIVFVIGNNLVIIPDLNYNSDSPTKDISRWDTRDTLISTFRYIDN